MITRRSLSVSILVSILLLFSNISITPAHASTYNCETANFTQTYGGHCYGLSQWNGRIDGSAVRIKVVQLVAPNLDTGYTGIIDQEMWLGQFSTDSWGEVGYTTWENETTPYHESYFWGGMNPHTGEISAFGLDEVQSTDINQYADFLMQNDQNDGYVIEQIHTPRDLLPIEHFYAYMVYPNEYSFGSELDGVSGGSSGTAVYINNEFYTASNNSWNWQQAQPTVQAYIEGPERMAENVAPSYSSHGGTFSAWCGC